MPEGERDAVRVEVGGGVVAEELRIAEGETGAVTVVGVPGGEGDDRREERDDPERVVAALFWFGVGLEEGCGFDEECEGERGDDGGLFGERGEGEDGGGEDLVFGFGVEVEG